MTTCKRLQAINLGMKFLSFQTNCIKDWVRQKLPKLYGGYMVAFHLAATEKGPANGVIRRDESHLGTRMVLVKYFEAFEASLGLGNDGKEKGFLFRPDLHLAQPPLPAMAGFVNMEHGTGFRAMLREQSVRRPTSTVTSQCHSRPLDVRLVRVNFLGEQKGWKT